MARPFVIGLIHPAHLLRGQWKYEPAQIHYLKLVVRALGGEEIEEFDPDGALPECALTDPSIKQIEEWLTDPLCEQGVAIDIENAGPHLICVGICRVVDEAYICVRFRSSGGAPYWADHEIETVVEAMYQFLASPKIPKCFHNGQAHDIPYLEYLGFRVEGYSFDTMIASHVCYSEMPKGLEFLSILLAGAQPWKYLTKEKDQAEGK